MKFLKKILGLANESNDIEQEGNQNISSSTVKESELSEESFWSIIQAAVNLSDGTYYDIYYKLDDLLNELEADKVLKFQNTYNHFIEYGCTSKMYAASRIIYAPDAEVDWNELELRELLESIIAKGFKFYHDTLDNPDTLAMLDDIEFGSEIHDMTQDVLYNKGVSYENNFTIDLKLIEKIKIDDEKIMELLPLLWAKYLPEKLKHQHQKNTISEAAQKLKDLD